LFTIRKFLDHVGKFFRPVVVLLSTSIRFQPVTAFRTLACALLSTSTDARLVSLGITGLTGSNVFSVTFANADAGREQFFLISEDDLAPVPEPGTLLLLATSLLGIGGVAWRRQRRSPASP
jgi:hypothetical protein